MEKIAIGAVSLITPSCVVLIGTEKDGKPNFMAVSYSSIVQDDPAIVMISSSTTHATNKIIKANKTFSVNIPSMDMLKKVDQAGWLSGKEYDKSSLFEIEYGRINTAPLIKDAPISMECSLVQTLYIGTKYEMFIGKIEQTYVKKEIQVEGKIDTKKLNPILYSISDDTYYSLGDAVISVSDLRKTY